MFRSILSTIALSLSFSVSATDISRQGDVDYYHSHYNNPNSNYHQKNIGNEVLYQIVVDRFLNGNRANDCIHKGRNCARGQKRRLDKWYAYQGGDIRGIIKSIPYLKDLGVTRLWLTPIFENNQVHAGSLNNDGRVTSYHGYWIRDWFQLNPYFTDKGSKDFSIVKELIKKSGSDMRIYLDTVANHSSPADASKESLQYLNKIEPIDSPYKVEFPHRGALFRSGKFWTNFDIELGKYKKDSSYEPVFHPWNRNIKDWNNKWEVENLQLARLADFNQDNANLRKYLKAAHHFWMKNFPGLAGYRIDTIKHVPHGFWRSFGADLYRSYPKMEAFGEYWDAGPLNSSSHPFYNQTKMSMLDFNTRTVLERIFGREGASMRLLSQMWKRDGSLGDARSLITFIDNHDLPRLRATGFPYQRMKQAIVTWMVSRGVPVIYYGLEQDLFNKGASGDPFNRPMMNFKKSPDMYKTMKRLIRLRKKNLSLRYGVTHLVHETEKIVAFERIYKGQVVFMATSTNNSSAGVDKFYVDDLKMPDGSYRDLLNGKVYKIENGRIPLELANGDIVLLTNAY